MVLIQPLQNPQLLSFHICLAVSSDTTGYVPLLVWSRDFENLCVLHAQFNSCPQDNVFKNPQHKLRTKNLIRTYVNLVREYELPHFPVSCRELFYRRVGVYSKRGALLVKWCTLRCTCTGLVQVHNRRYQQSINSCYNDRFFMKGLPLILRKFYK
jgi:hypothetical protein